MALTVPLEFDTAQAEATIDFFTNRLQELNPEIELQVDQGRLSSLFDGLSDSLGPSLRRVQTQFRAGIDALRDPATFRRLGSSIGDGIRNGVSFGLNNLGAVFTGLGIGAALLGELDFSAITDALAPVLEAVTGLIQPLIERFAEFVSGIDFTPIIDGLTIVFDAISQIDIGAIFESFAPIFEVLGELLATLAPVIATVIGFLGQLVSGALAAVLPLIADGIGFLVGAIQSLLDSNPDLLNTIMDAFSEILNALLPVIIEISGPLLEIGQAIITALLPAVRPLLPLFLRLLPILADVVVFILNLIPPIVNLAARFNLFSVAQAIFQRFGGVISTVVGGITVAFNAIRTAISFVIDQVQQRIQLGIDIFNSIRDKAIEIRDRITGAFNDIKDGVQGPIDDVRDFIQGLIDRIQGLIDKINIIPDVGGVLGSVGGALNPFDGDIIPGFATGGVTNRRQLAWLSEQNHPEAIVSSMASPRANFGFINQAGLADSLAPLFQQAYGNGGGSGGGSVFHISVESSGRSSSSQRLTGHNIGLAINRTLKRRGLF